MVNTHAVKHAVRSCKVNIFKHTPCFFSVTKRHIGNDTVLCDGDDLTGKHIADKLCSDGVQSAGLRRKNIGVFPFSDTEGLKTLGISGSHELSRTRNDQRICAFYLFHGICHRLFGRLCLYPFSGDMVSDDFGVDGGLENGAVIGKLSAKLWCIDKISVVGQCQRPFHIIQHQRLVIFSGAAAGRGVTDMADSDVPFQSIKSLRCEYLIAEPHPSVGIHNSLRPVCIADCDSAAFLPPMLQSAQSIINR